MIKITRPPSSMPSLRPRRRYRPRIFHSAFAIRVKFLPRAGLLLFRRTSLSCETTPAKVGVAQEVPATPVVPPWKTISKSVEAE